LLIDQLLQLGWLDVIDLIAEMAGEFGLALSGLDPWSLGQSRWPRSGLTAAPELAATPRDHHRGCFVVIWPKCR